jgi:hypothetical protein
MVGAACQALLCAALLACAGVAVAQNSLNEGIRALQAGEYEKARVLLSNKWDPEVPSDVDYYLGLALCGKGDRVSRDDGLNLLTRLRDVRQESKRATPDDTAKINAAILSCSDVARRSQAIVIVSPRPSVGGIGKGIEIGKTVDFSGVQDLQIILPGSKGRGAPR